MPKSDNYVYTFITYVYHESYPHMLASFTVLATTLQLRLTLQLPSSLVPRDSPGFPRESLLKRDNTGISLLSAIRRSDRPSEFASEVKFDWSVINTAKKNVTYRHNRK